MSDPGPDGTEHHAKARAGMLDCTCPWGWRSLGKLHGIMMGHGWVRLKDDPNCRMHPAPNRMKVPFGDNRKPT